MCGKKWTIATMSSKHFIQCVSVESNGFCTSASVYYLNKDESVYDKNRLAIVLDYDSERLFLLINRCIPVHVMMSVGTTICLQL